VNIVESTPFLNNLIVPFWFDIKILPSGAKVIPVTVVPVAETCTLLKPEGKVWAFNFPKGVNSIRNIRLNAAVRNLT
jgi:hypothetical protein